MIQKTKPWKFSTGAKSLAGKKISSKNALKHGYRSADAIADQMAAVLVAALLITFIASIEVSGKK
ncbi:hypothetical protein [Pleurocapsa sp. FMAR1]|uniref:hypothetical protein n=1 Tax=Pleurocapsa sp. FMAR1 TaxID=3040204 RepID=UPI0029C6DB9E|nr:hypothetical protein [Pleurocapsa sp. FMAR1]